MSDQPNIEICFRKQEGLESGAEGRQRRCRRNLQVAGSSTPVGQQPKMLGCKQKKQ